MVTMQETNLENDTRPTAVALKKAHAAYQEAVLGVTLTLEKGIHGLIPLGTDRHAMERAWYAFVAASEAHEEATEPEPKRYLATWTETVECAGYIEATSEREAMEFVEREHEYIDDAIRDREIVYGFSVTLATD